jgi:polysaccharide export outer membrane protein
MLHVHVFEAPELEQNVQVDDKGNLPLIVGGSVPVKGLSPEQAARSIRDRLMLGQFVLNPHVSVTIDKYATQNVTVMGQVRVPGTYFVATPRTALDVLALAGGLGEGADRHITIERGRTGERISYFLSNDSDKALTDNVRIYPGDRIIVPKAKLIYMLGDFNRPGAYAALTNDAHLTVLQAVAYAGGTPPTAVPAHAVLIHHEADGSYTKKRLPLSAMQKGKKPDLSLTADDIIYVPYSYLRNIAVNITSLVSAATGAVIYQVP